MRDASSAQVRTNIRAFMVNTCNVFDSTSFYLNYTNTSVRRPKSTHEKKETTRGSVERHP